MANISDFFNTQDLEKCYSQNIPFSVSSDTTGKSESVKLIEYRVAESWNVDSPRIAENAPWFSAMSTFEDDPLILDDSYGYNMDHFNLCIVEHDKLLWATGNILHIFDVTQKQLTFRRSAFGQDIACICAAPSRNLVAICEKGGDHEGSNLPIVIVYKWPDFAVETFFVGGTSQTYTSAGFNSNGMRIAVIGEEPLRLTIFNFKNRKPQVSIQLECGAIKRALFSPYDPNFLVTYGKKHLKFWHSGSTDGSLSEVTAKVELMEWDINALMFFPDTRTITNSEEGSLAVWDSNGTLLSVIGLNSFEPTNSPLVFIQFYEEINILYTAGYDGVVRVWDAKDVFAQFGGEGLCSRSAINPCYERFLKNDDGGFGKLVQMLPKQNATHPFHFYAQDALQGIWLLDLELKKKPDRWVCVFPSQTNPVADISPSPADYFLCVLGKIGELKVFSKKGKRMVVSTLLPEVGSSILWLPLSIDSSGSHVIIGFESGVLRLAMLMINAVQMPGGDSVRWVQTLKPHTLPVTVLTISAKDLIISGSKDGSIFLFTFLDNRVVPVGLVRMPGPVCDITWNQFRADEHVVLVSCENGIVVECALTDEYLNSLELSEERETYVLSVPLVFTQAKIRSQIQKARSFSSRYLNSNMVWTEEKSTSHRYHNYVYEIGGNATAKLSISDGRVVHSCIDLCYGNYLLLGTNYGTLKMIKTGDCTDSTTMASAFLDSWESKMHEVKSSVTKLCLSHDQRILYSCGTDQGIFAYKVNLTIDSDMEFQSMPMTSELPEGIDPTIVPDLCLEDEKILFQQEKETTQRKLAVEKIKRAVLFFLGKYYELYESNKSLPKCLRIPELFFRLDTPLERSKKRIEDAKKRYEEVLTPFYNVVEKLFVHARLLYSNFVGPIRTSTFYVFAIRSPYYLKSFPEKELYSVDPIKQTDDDLEFLEWKKRWVSAFSGNIDSTTAFRQLVEKAVLLLKKENEGIAFSDSLNRLVKRNFASIEITEINNRDDSITSAGQFVIEHGKLSMREKHLFKKLNKIRVKKLRSVSELTNLRVVEKKLQQHLELIQAALETVLKAERKDEERFPSVLERLVDLLNIRQVIHFRKESFNADLKSLRKKKIQMFRFDYWAREELKYMQIDMKKWGFDFEHHMPTVIVDVLGDLECPETAWISTGSMPDSIAERLAFYEQESRLIEALSTMHESKFREKSAVATMVLNRREAFKNSVIIIKETLDSMIVDFDQSLFELLLKRNSLASDLGRMKEEYNVIAEEINILYRLKIMQAKTFRYRNEILKAKYFYCFRENVKKKKIKLLNESIKDRLKTVEDINVRFAVMIKDDKWEKHLTRTYRRKYKAPRGSQSTESSDSESSSDDDDDDDDGFNDFDMTDDDNSSLSSVTGVAYLYDEEVMPPGCDEEKFRLTFQLRYLRHAEENKIAEFRKIREWMVGESAKFRCHVKMADGLLAIFHSRSIHYQEMMKNELEDVRSRRKSQKWTSHEDLEPGSLEEAVWIKRNDREARLALLNRMKENVCNAESQLADRIQAMRAQMVKLEKVVNKNPLEGMEETLNARWKSIAEADEALNNILVSLIKKGLRKCENEIKANEKLAQREKERKAALQQKAKIRKMKLAHLKHLHALYAVEAEKNRKIIENLVGPTNANKMKKS